MATPSTVDVPNAVRASADVARAERERLVRVATWASLAVAVVLVGAKFAAWVLTDSVSLLSSLVDSSLDLLASAITWLAIRHSQTPADREHRFGHGKAEALAALAQGGFILASSFGLILTAIERLQHPQPVVREGLALAVMALSVCATLGLVMFQRHVVGRTGSLAIGADALHYRGDLAVNVAVVIALLVTTRFGIAWFDAAAACAIALWLLFGVWSVSRGALDQLMDRELPEIERDRIKAIVRGHRATRDIHDLRSRVAGGTRFIQLHVEFDPATSLLEAHRLGDEIELAILGAFPDAEVILHLDPHGVEERRPAFGRT